MQGRYRMLRLSRTALLGALGAAVLSSAAVAAPHSIAETIDAAIGETTFNRLWEAASAAGLLDALDGEGPFTLLAPTDAAFAALPEGELARLMEPGNRDELAAILRGHVVPGALRAEEIAGLGGPLTGLDGAELSVAVDDEVRVAGTGIVAADIPATNGVIHAIDRVILVR